MLEFPCRHEKYTNLVIISPNICEFARNIFCANIMFLTAFTSITIYGEKWGDEAPLSLTILYRSLVTLT